MECVSGGTSWVWLKVWYFPDLWKNNCDQPFYRQKDKGKPKLHTKTQTMIEWVWDFFT